MRIESMTATFGTLEHRTLEFTPGLNILSGENEWGKSTWCAFLLAMLYGLDTRAKTTRQALSPKERYTPWSGSPMSGTVALNWNGRRVTLERTTKGRVPMGVFRAYETETGLPVPELTADNCGQTLLGVEREVFCRAGFIRQEEMPVTQSEALRARLNALVTTGDEGVDEAALARKLKELKNKCRFNQSGLLPQAEKQLRELEEALRERERLEGEISRLEGQLALTEAYLQSLKTHQAALDYAKASMDARQVQKARAEAEKAAREADKMEEICADLPTRAEAEKRLRDLAAHMNAWNEAGAERSRCAQMPELPQAPEVFRGLSGEQALQKAREDGKAYRSIVGRGFWTFLILAALSILGGLVLLLGFGELIPALVYFGVGTLLLAVSLLVGSREKEKQKALTIPYGGGTPDAWEAKARTYADALQRYYNEKQDWTHRQTEQEQQLQGLRDQREFLCEGREPREMEELCRQVLSAWDTLEVLRGRKETAQRHLETLSAMAAQETTPVQDELTLSPEETDAERQAAQERVTNLSLLLGGERSRLEALGSRESLETAHAQTRERIKNLQRYYDALTLAQQTLTEASQSLQRRFAPQISEKAQKWMSAMTDGRYNRLLLSEDLTLRAGAEGETTLREVLCRSSGTEDQLYLALRLAVAETIAPEAPLILDDALVRFDDNRMSRAMEVLKEISRDKQVILFSCQSREKSLYGI